MKHVRTILITIALLAMQPAHAGEIPHNSNDTTESSVSVSEPEIKEIDNLQLWNDHLALLTSNDEYWDSENHNPTVQWENDAFDLAEKIVTQDSSYAETLKTDFITALNKKTTNFLDINSLITKFNTFIDNLVSSAQTTATAVETTPAAIEPETVAPVSEPVAEPAPSETESSETSSSQNSETSSSTTNEKNDSDPINEDQIKKNWLDQLEKVKREGENWVQTDDILNKTYEVAKELLRLPNSKETALQSDFYKALLERSDIAKIKPIYNNFSIEEVMQSFSNSIGISSGSSENPFNQQYERNVSEFNNSQAPTTDPRDKRLEQLEKEYAQKDAQFRAEQIKAEDNRRIILAAAQRAQEEGTLAKEQVYKLAETQKQIDEEYKKKRAEDLKEINDAKKLLLQYTEQIAANQTAVQAAEKATAEQGYLSAFRQGLSNWWYGTPDKAADAPVLKNEQALLSQMVKDVPHHQQEKAKQAFKDFQHTLLAFSNAEYWDAQQSLPNLKWIAKMDELIKDIVITYRLMDLNDALTFVENILKKSGKISAPALKNILTKISTKTNKIFDEEDQKKKEKELIVQRRQEKKEQILLAQQRDKEEKDKIIAEKNRLAQAATSYKQEKKQWYDLLDKLAHNKQATPEHNHTQMQEALQKSQSLLQLAGDIPAKDKAKISQKLKQKFSVALLNQQKVGAQGTNVYHNMDLFNKEINKMIE